MRMDCHEEIAKGMKYYLTQWHEKEYREQHMGDMGHFLYLVENLKNVIVIGMRKMAHMTRIWLMRQGGQP